MTIFTIGVYDGMYYKIFYLTDYDNVEQLIITTFNYLLSPKYHNKIVYIHNFVKFDLIFILEILHKHFNVSIKSLRKKLFQLK